MRIPEEIMRQLVMFCESNGVGIIQAHDAKAGVMILLLGPRGMSPIRASLIGSSILIGGILIGQITGDIEEEEESNSKPN
jgi:hypothetical protein